MTQIAVRNIRLPFTCGEKEVFSEAVKRLRGITSRADISRFSLYKRSVDARHRDDIRFVSTVLVETEAEVSDDALAKADCMRLKEGVIEPEFGDETLNGRPVIIGFGPCGMFCAMLLADYGYRPLVLERGGDAVERSAAVKRFYSDRILDPNCNIQFGAGGAGTFSDGKLVTRINDPKCRLVLEKFYALGAPEAILVESKPHIGTDRLLEVVASADKYIRERGGEILYHTSADDFVFGQGGINAVQTASGQIPCGAVILATGHSARDTYQTLFKRGFDITAKPFSVGVRIEQLQNDIDRALYGRHAGNPTLGHAEYSFAHKVGGRGVYTFCMCPGGEVVAAASEEGGVVTNGMSRFARDSRNANSAIAVEVMPDAPLDFQRKLERAAFSAAGGNYNAPVQTVGDFLTGKHGSEPSRVKPSYMGGDRYTLCDLHNILPSDICDMLTAGLADFGRKLKGFDAPDAVLTGVESRTSAPYRILRSENYISPAANNFYPCGEGAGYAGGITSAATDGLSCALAVMKRYKQPNG